MKHKFSKAMYRVIRWVIEKVYVKMDVVGRENLPEDEAVIIVGNHCQMHGPIACELFFPEKRYTWCAGEMMHLKEVPAYAYKDFWSQKPKWIRWWYKIMSYLIAPLSVVIFNNANTIGVYRDTRILSTFKTTVARLQEGNHVVVFPEHDAKYNNIVYQFQERFVDVAKLYYKRTGKEVLFVPLYIAPDIKKMMLGKPICFCADAPIDEERSRLCSYLMEQITEIACDLPLHTVVPYRNIPKKQYPKNILTEDIHEKTNG